MGNNPDIVGSEVICVADNGEKSQWGQGFFFFRDGYKWTLRSKSVAISFGVVFCGLSLLQLLIETPSVQTRASTPPVLSADMPKKESLSILEPYDSKAAPARGRTRNQAPSKLSAPQLVLSPRSVAIPPGLMAEAILKSGASNGIVRAELTESLSFNGEEFIQAGSILVGHGASTEERLYVGFKQAVFSDGTTTNIQAQACDLSDRIVGLKGAKLGAKTAQIAGSIGLGFIGGLSEGFQDVQGTQGVQIRPPSLKNALLNATATTALEQSRNLMSDLKEHKPIIEVPGGEKICVIFGGDR